MLVTELDEIPKYGNSRDFRDIPYLRNVSSVQETQQEIPQNYEDDRRSLGTHAGELGFAWTNRVLKFPGWSKKFEPAISEAPSRAGDAGY
jgi:hypothetical protein